MSDKNRIASVMNVLLPLPPFLKDAGVSFVCSIFSRIKIRDDNL
jgi:hypothetical protein